MSEYDYRSKGSGYEPEVKVYEVIRELPGYPKGTRFTHVKNAKGQHRYVPDGSNGPVLFREAERINLAELPKWFKPVVSPE